MKTETIMEEASLQGGILQPSSHIHRRWGKKKKTVNSCIRFRFKEAPVIFCDTKIGNQIQCI